MKKLSVGVAKVNISPPVRTPLSGYFVEEGRVDGSREIHDDLYAKALVLDNGAEQAVIITTDLIYIPRALAQSTRELIKHQTGIEEKNVLVSASHTHSGPILFPNLYGGVLNRVDEEYLTGLPRRIAGAVYMARRRMQMAKIGVGKGFCNININRRETTSDGRVVLGKDPDGVVDREVGVLRFDSSEGMMAILMNYTCHAVSLGPNLEISADYPGYTMQFVEKMEGKSVAALFTNGTQGNIAPTVSPEVDPGSFEDARRLGTILGAEVLKTAEQIEVRDCERLKIVSKEIELPINRALPDIKKTERAIEERERKYTESGGRQVEAKSLERRNESIRQYLKRNALEEGLEVAWAKAQLQWRKYIEKMSGHVDIQVIAINDAVFASIPGEMFVEIGLDVKKKSRYGNTFLIGLANGHFGYIPTREAYSEGGYEAGATPLAPEAGELIRNTILELIQGL